MQWAAGCVSIASAFTDKYEFVCIYVCVYISK